MKKILLVDDSSDVIKVLTRILNSTYPGFEILTARNGIEAIHCHEKNDNIAVSIIDQHMPNMNGVDAIVHIRNHINPNAEIVLLSAYRDDIEIEHRLDPKVLAGPLVILLSKPITKDLLKIVLDGMI